MGCQERAIKQALIKLRARGTDIVEMHATELHLAKLY